MRDGQDVFFVHLTGVDPAIEEHGIDITECHFTHLVPRAASAREHETCVPYTGVFHDRAHAVFLVEDILGWPVPSQNRAAATLRVRIRSASRSM